MSLTRYQQENARIIALSRADLMADGLLAHIPEAERAQAINLALECTKPTDTMVEYHLLAKTMKALRNDDTYTAKDIEQKILSGIMKNNLVPGVHYTGTIRGRKKGGFKASHVLVKVETVLPMILQTEFPDDIAVNYFCMCYGRLAVTFRKHLTARAMVRSEKSEKIAVYKDTHRSLCSTFGDAKGIAGNIAKHTLSQMVPGEGTQLEKCRIARGDAKAPSGSATLALNAVALGQKAHYDHMFDVMLKGPTIQAELAQIDDPAAKRRRISQKHAEFMESVGPTVNYLWMEGATEAFNAKQMYDEEEEVLKKLGSPEIAQLN
jgi:hypothetical protein